MPSTPILPQAVWASGTNQNSIPANDNSLRQEIFHGYVISQAVTAQPASPAEGDIYIIAATHTGAQWAGFTPNDLAIYKSGTWLAYAPTKGAAVNVAGSPFQFNGSAWASYGGGVTDGDKGDITVSSSGTAWSIDNQTITYAKLQNVSAQYRVLGRNSAAAGSAEEVTLSQLLDWVGSAANGDLLYRSGGVWTRLAVGTNGQVLTLASGLPSWAAASGGLTNPMTASGDMIYGGTAGVPTRLAAGTNGYVLTLVAGVPAWAAASGGGGLTGFTSSLSTASPNNTTNASQLLASGGTTNQSAVLSPKGTGAVSAHMPDSTSVGGNIRGTNAVDWQTSRGTNTNVASGANSVICGGANGTASGLNSSVLGGTSAIASGDYSAAWGAVVTAGGAYSTAFGYRATTRGLTGCYAFASGMFSIQGDAQQSDFVQRIQTTNATPAALSADQNAPSATTGIVLPNNSVYGFEAIVCARANATGDAAVFKITGAIKRGASAATTALLGTPTVTATGADAGASAWTAVAAANTTLGSLEIRVTGVAATNIKWVASVKTTEVVG